MLRGLTALIDLEAAVGNMGHIARAAGGRPVIAVVKADAYGHGAAELSRAFIKGGATSLAIAFVSEARELREAGIKAPLLVLFDRSEIPAFFDLGLIPVIHDIKTAQEFSKEAMRRNTTIPVHVKVDTGMGRLGLLPPDVTAFVKEIAPLPGLFVEGIFTHFAIADSEDKSYTLSQLGRFNRVLAELEGAGIEIPIVHAANSAAILGLPESHFDMVRLGIAMYGLSPSAQVKCPPGFRPALTFRTEIAQVKELPAGSYISYDCTFCTQRPSVIAVIPVGYADGFRRAPSNWREVLVRGQRAPVVGRVCMDQTMIDVTDIPGVRQGDDVVLIGRQGRDAITVEEVAEWLGTINYEVVSEILARVPRVS